jgi:hypothetical protein
MDRRTFFLAALSAAGLGCRPAGEEAIWPFLAPSELAARLGEVGAGKLVVLYIGPEILFRRARIPGAQNLGEAGSAAGIAALQAALVRVPAATELVVYCGCCAVRNCPNVRPASAAIRAAHRQNARLLDLPTRLQDDWTDKGYPVERG